MVQLRSCYFCGTTGTLSEYETLPPRLQTDTDDTPRVILCDRCHTKLTAVLDPLVARLERPTTAGRDDPDRTDLRSDEPTGQPEVTFTSPPPTTTSAAVDDGDAADGDDSAVATGDEAPPERQRDRDYGETEATDLETEASVDEHERESEHENKGGDEEEHEDEVGDAADADDRERASADLDRVYHKLLRFLRNREFPIPRTEAEAIAQSAYDLSAREASQVIQRTVDRGVLEERDGDLHRR